MNKKFRSWRHQRQGMITWVNIFSIFIMLVLASFVFNSLSAVNKKIETQNAADAVAYTGAVWMARGMNSISVTNHLIGEINAVYTMHHAIGGEWLDQKGTRGIRNSGDWKTLPYKRSDGTWSIPLINLYGGGTYKVTVGGLYGLYVAANAAWAYSEFWDWITGRPNNGPNVEWDHFERIRKHPYSDVNSSVFEATQWIKFELNATYLAHTAASVAFAKAAKGWWPTIWSPPKHAIVRAAMAAAAAKQRGILAIQRQLYREYGAINILERFAIRISPGKQLLPKISNVLHDFQRVSVSLLFPGATFYNSQEIAERHNKKGFFVRDIVDSPSLGELSEFIGLPVEHERAPSYDTADKFEGRSQMVRATYPWVRFWRRRLVGLFTVAAPLSGLGDSYVKWTNKYSRQSSQWLRWNKEQFCSVELTHPNRRTRGTGKLGNGLRMYVIQGLNQAIDEGKDKGKEKWNEPTFAGTWQADELFCSVGYALAKKPSRFSPTLFRQENPHGVLAYSQAMIYNANPQIDLEKQDVTFNAFWGWFTENVGVFVSIRDVFGTLGDLWDSFTSWFTDEKQPPYGWDTLAWDHEEQPVKEWEDPWWLSRVFFDNPITGQFSPAPLIKPNWQARLTPVTGPKLIKTSVTVGALDTLIGDGDVTTILRNGREAQLWLKNH